MDIQFHHRVSRPGAASHCQMTWGLNRKRNLKGGESDAATATATAATATATATAATATAATAGVSVKRNRTAKALVGATGPTGRGTSSRRRESQGPDQTSFQVVEARSSRGCRTATVTTQRLRIDPPDARKKGQNAPKIELKPPTFRTLCLLTAGPLGVFCTDAAKHSCESVPVCSVGRLLRGYLTLL